MDNVEVAGYCDIVPDLLQEFGNNWHDRWPDAKPYTDYKQMLAEANLDILTVGTSDNRHADMVVDAANSGVKAIMCEKPLATTIEDANRMIKACEENGVQLSVGHTKSWDPMYHKIRDMVRDGEIGQVKSITATLGGPRAMMFRNGTHRLHGLVFFADSEPTHVIGLLEEGFDHWDEYRGDGGKTPESEPAVSGIIKFENGVRAYFDCTKNAFDTSSITISGTKGKITLVNGTGMATLESADDSGDTISRTIKPMGIVSNYQTMGYVAAYEELIALAESGGGESVGSGRQARQVVQILTGFLKSHQAGSALVEVPS
jgi:predicted dehydrogenase